MEQTRLASALILAAGAGAAHLCASSRFHRRIQSAVARVDAAGATRPVPRDDLPNPVARFVDRAAPSFSPVAATVRLHQRGEMRFSPQSGWRPFTAEQTIAVHQPGFVWHARCTIAPLVNAEVIDSYVEGKGRLEARLMGSIPVATAQGRVTDKAELMRYLAELPWVPSAFLYNRLLRWRALDERTFDVSADSAGGEASVRLMLDERGDVVGARADDRPRTEGNRSVPQGWFGVFAGHKELCGYRVPTTGEVSWELETGPFTYWRGEIVALELDPQT